MINGVKCYAPTSRKELIDFAFKENAILVAVNAEKILHATDHSRAIINRNVGYPDGIGAVWALEKKGCENVVKIPGCELWLDVISQNEEDKSFYLVGGKEEIILATITKLKENYPKINIVNYRNGYLSADDEKILIQDIQEKKADVVFVAMGSPKQELLMEEMRKNHTAVYQGLGGSFDVYTENVKRAPKWWVRNNLEWAYRSIKQPSRIKRQLKLFKFLFLLKLNKL